MQNPSLHSIPRANVLGVGVHALDMMQAVRVVQEAIERDRKGYICVTSVHGIMEAQRDPVFRKTLDEALLVTPDGMPTVWVGRWQGLRNMGRVFGPDLMREVCRESVRLGHSHFLYGGNPGVVEQLKCNLEDWFPGIRVVGTCTPPFRPLSDHEREALVHCVSTTKPDIVWVGLSTPKQEHFMHEYISLLDTKVMIGVGAAFDLHTGRIKDAPVWMKRAGIQWLHRLCQDPRRLWKRYLVNNTLFAMKIVRLMMVSRNRHADFTIQ